MLWFVGDLDRLMMNVDARFSYVLHPEVWMLQAAEIFMAEI